MLSARLQAIGGARTLTSQDSQHCRLLLLSGLLRTVVGQFGFLVRDTIVQKSKLTTTQRTTCFARNGSWVYKGDHPGAEWESQLRGALNEQCTNRTEEL